MSGSKYSYDDIKRIMNSTDIEYLREQAIGLKVDKSGIERDSDTMTSMNILGITVLFAITSLVLLFLEIAARGSNYRQ